MNPANNAYAAYVKAVGGQTFDGRPLPTFEQLGERQQAGWAAAADSLGLAHSIGDEITTKSGIKGVVANVGLTKAGQRYYLIDGTDNTGRPFEHFVNSNEAL